ncbi:hypothetical protein DUI87_17101 [Hirundo rustica rustica]|uniref:Uncharacterized protein n=1 Tax=Hirundo rustica rustica TaxID=333673 RepID=A0A3M0K2Y7_HIRRU|nr:hypothetical protein DUI87_17101 [Hirundo rustica rustica]
MLEITIQIQITVHSVIFLEQKNTWGHTLVSLSHLACLPALQLYALHFRDDGVTFGGSMPHLALVEEKKRRRRGEGEERRGEERRGERGEERRGEERRGEERRGEERRGEERRGEERRGEERRGEERRGEERRGEERRGEERREERQAH